MAHATSQNDALRIAGINHDCVQEVFAFETDERFDYFISVVKQVVPDNAAEKPYIGGEACWKHTLAL